MSIDTAFNEDKTSASPLVESGLFKKNTKINDHFKQTLQAEHDMRVGNANRIDLNQNSLAFSLEVLCRSVTAHQPQGDAELMRYLCSKFDHKVIQHTAQAIQLTQNTAVKNLLHLLHFPEADDFPEAVHCLA